MPTTKVSLRLDEELVAEARRLVGHRGLSSYVNRALARHLQHHRLAGLLDELEEEMGPIENEILESVRRTWTGPGGSAGDVGAASKP